MSFSRPGLPTIWIRRDGWEYEAFAEMYLTQAQKKAARADQVERYLTSAAKAGKFLTKTNIEEAKLYKEMGLTQELFRAALIDLGRRIEDRELPEEEKQGARKTFLCPVGVTP